MMSKRPSVSSLLTMAAVVAACADIKTPEPGPPPLDLPPDIPPDHDLIEAFKRSQQRTRDQSALDAAKAKRERKANKRLAERRRSTHPTDVKVRP